MSDKKKSKKCSFSTIKHYNSPNRATTVDGDVIEREDKVWLGTFRRFVACAPYDNHFIYLDPSKKQGRWNPMCTCGSPAVVVGADVYKDLASPSKDGTVPGELAVCYVHMLTKLNTGNGKHSDGSS